MIRATAKKPHLRKQGIDDQAKFLGLENDPYLRQFGISVERQQVSVRGKVIPAPKIGYAQQQSVQAQGELHVFMLDYKIYIFRDSFLIQSCILSAP